jgi:tetrahydromethanopterin S-methyltransferase subunit E
MKRGLRGRFYAETILGAITGILFVATLINQQWIETVFNIDPDQGQGWLEWLIVGILLVATIVCGFLARYEWRRAAVSAA